MARIRLLGMIVLTLLLVPTFVKAQQTGTLHAPERYKDQQVDFCLDFKNGLNGKKYGPCDLQYGLLGINNNFDWLQVANGGDTRSVIKDLGAHDWNEKFIVPVMAALPKLAPGEQRIISIDTSGGRGRNGTDVRPGLPGTPGLPGADGGANAKVDPAFIRAVAGHMYVVHVVDDTHGNDFYSLVRVDKLGDLRCSVSWKVIPTPMN
jgi:hypothetical protein